MDKELLTIPISATIIAAAEKIERNHLRAVLVVEGEKVVGVCSQGDIMRLLLRGGSVYTPLDKVATHNFIFLKDKDWQKARTLIQEHGITLVPILDSEFRLQDVITLPMLWERLEFSSPA